MPSARLTEDDEGKHGSVSGGGEGGGEAKQPFKAVMISVASSLDSVLYCADLKSGVSPLTTDVKLMQVPAVVRASRKFRPLPG
jgi:hypothetical protein